MLQTLGDVKMKVEAGMCSSPGSVVAFIRGEKTFPRKGRRSGEEESENPTDYKKTPNQSITYEYLICVKETFKKISVIKKR